MPDCELRAALVVRQQAERVGVLHAGEHVDHRQAAHGGLDRFAPIDPPRRHDESVDPFAEQLIDVPPLAQRIVGGVAHEDGDAVIEQAPLDRCDDRKAEPAEAVGREDADGHRTRPMQALREIIRAKAEVLGGGDDALAGFLAQSALVVERLGHGPDADLRPPRDVVNGALFTSTANAVIGRLSARRMDALFACAHAAPVIP